MKKIRGDRARQDAHVAYVRAHPELAIGGPKTILPSQDFPGAIWTVEADTREAVEKLILQDPYYVPSLRSYKISS